MDNLTVSSSKEEVSRSLPEKTAGTSFHEEIAKTYFKTSDVKTGKRKISSKIPWLVALVSILLALIVIASKSHIEVRVRILSEVPSAGNDLLQKNQFDKGIFLVKGSGLNKSLIKAVSFKGDAKAFSRIASDQLILCNSTRSGWANYTVELKEPVDLNRLDIRYAAKGQRGDEHISIVIVDSDNRSYRVGNEMRAQLTKDWQTYTIDLKSVKGAVDLANISSIGFEFGSLTAGNRAVTTIFLKDICLTKTKRGKWL